jgi:hypothetical protein
MSLGILNAAQARICNEGQEAYVSRSNVQDVASCSLSAIRWCFRGTHNIYLLSASCCVGYSSTWKTEAVGFSETSLDFYWTTRVISRKMAFFIAAAVRTMNPEPYRLLTKTFLEQLITYFCWIWHVPQRKRNNWRGYADTDEHTDY